MDNRDRLINDLAIENTKLRIENMQLRYDLDEFNSLKQELELKKLEITELRKKEGAE